MYLTNIQHKSKVRGSLPLINYEPKEQGVYQWQTSNDLGQGLYICQIHCSSHGSYDTYILWICHTSMLHGLSTMKTNYIYVLYFVVDWSSWTDIEFIVTMVSHVIDEFKFQQVIYCNINIKKKSLCFSYSCFFGFYIIEHMSWSCGIKYSINVAYHNTVII